MEFFRIIIETGDQYQVSNPVDDTSYMLLKLSKIEIILFINSKG